MGHDILISVDSKMISEFYSVLLAYIGTHYPKIKPKESNKKNGIRVIQARLKNKVSKKQIKKLAQTRLYFFQNTVIMDIEPTVAIYRELLLALTEMTDKSDRTIKMLQGNFIGIKEEHEQYSHRLAIFEEIYRVLQTDALTNAEALTLCNKLADADKLL